MLKPNMESKELDCVLIEGKDTDGLVLRFTLRGANPQELKDKVDKVKQLWFPTFVPNTTTYAEKPATSQTVSVSEGLANALGNCPKCGAPNKISKQGKKYCSATCWLK